MLLGCHQDVSGISAACQRGIGKFRNSVLRMWWGIINILVLMMNEIGVSPKSKCSSSVATLWARAPLQIAFHTLNPFPLRTINNKREHHQKVLKVSKHLPAYCVFSRLVVAMRAFYLLASWVYRSRCPSVSVCLWFCAIACIPWGSTSHQIFPWKWPNI